jgi:hypothetical protein
MDEYPHENGDVIVLGPQVFVSRDEAVLNWKGRNYVSQAERDRLRAVVERALDVVRPMADSACDADVLRIADLYRILAGPALGSEVTDE